MGEEGEQDGGEKEESKGTWGEGGERGEAVTSEDP